ncbi:MAG: hypothetical protein IPG69_06190 [Flavobacteriales bacterium]|nr:hypothetical protein [Flavobacteriales bacterium]
MKGDPQLIDTRSATMRLVSPELIEVQFKPEVKLDVQGLGEIVHAKNHLGQGLNPDVLAVAPPELDFELNVLHMDHAVGHGVKCNSNRLAFAAQSGRKRPLCSCKKRTPVPGSWPRSRSGPFRDLSGRARVPNRARVSASCATTIALPL